MEWNKVYQYGRGSGIKEHCLSQDGNSVVWKIGDGPDQGVYQAGAP